MKFKSIAFALLAFSLFATVAQAQNLFSTARPDYTRNFPATYHDRYVNNSYANGARYTTNRLNDVSYDQERLNRAWANYRAEAERYQTRYGSNYEAAAYSPVRPVAFESDQVPNRAPNRRCHSRRPDVPRDYRPSDFRPATDTTPSGSYYNPSYYDNGYGFGTGQSSSVDPYGTNLSKTASRPFGSLFDSLFGVNR